MGGHCCCCEARVRDALLPPEVTGSQPSSPVTPCSPALPSHTFAHVACIFVDGEHVDDAYPQQLRAIAGRLTSLASLHLVYDGTAVVAAPTAWHMAASYVPLLFTGAAPLLRRLVLTVPMGVTGLRCAVECTADTLTHLDAVVHDVEAAVDLRWTTHRHPSQLQQLALHFECIPGAMGSCHGADLACWLARTVACRARRSLRTLVFSCEWWADDELFRPIEHTFDRLLGATETSQSPYHQLTRLSVRMPRITAAVSPAGLDHILHVVVRQTATRTLRHLTIDVERCHAVDRMPASLLWPADPATLLHPDFRGVLFLSDGLVATMTA